MNTHYRALMLILASGALAVSCQASGNVAVTPGASSSPSAKPSTAASTTPSAAPSATTSAAPVALNFTLTFKALAGSATGTGSVTMGADLKSLTVTATATGLTGAASAAHIHRADTPGGSGGVVKTLTLSGNTATGTWTMTDASEALTQALIDDLKAGKLYVAFHTAANPNGELRADITVK